MNKNLKLKEKLLCYLDTLALILVSLLNLIVFLFIIIVLYSIYDVRYDIAACISIAIFFLLPSLVMTYFLSKCLFLALFKKNKEFDGLIIDKKEFPELYKIINEVRVKCKCPKLHVIALDYSNNAHVIEEYKFGFKLFKRRKLVLGAPLMLFLNERELKSVIAHECAHLSKVHSKSILKIITKIEELNKYIEKLNEKGHFDSFIDKKIKSQVIRLNNIYYQVRKNHEFEADKVSTKNDNKQTLINTLIKINFFNIIFSGYFWDYITELNKANEKIVTNIYFLMENAMKDNLKIPEEVYKNFLDKLRNLNSLPSSTHPSISERAKALGATIPSLDNKFHGDLISIFKADYKSALRTLFKNEANNILKTMSLKWADLSEEKWNEYYKYIEDLKASLDELVDLEKEKGLEIEQLIDKAHLTESLKNSDLAFELFKEALDIDPTNVAAKFNVARILLFKGDEEGIDLFTSIGEEEIQLRPNCCKYLYNYYLSVNKRSDAVNYYNYAVEFMKTNEEAADEREYIYFKDEFLPVDLSIETLEKVINEIIKYKEVKKAYIAIKKLNITQDFPLYIIGLKFKHFTGKKKKQDIFNDLSTSIYTPNILPWNFRILELNKDNRSIEYSINNVLDSRII